VVAKGYLTLDPRRYTEPVLSIVMPLVFLMLGGIGLPGGAVWINRGAIRSPIMQSLMSLAGPAASVGVGIVLGVPFILFPDTVLEHGAFASALAFLVALQFTSAALNLLPVPGLDGYGVIEPHLPADVRASLDRLRPVAFIMLFVLLWNVPQAWRVIWGPATRAMEAMQVPNGLAGLGLELFRFWR
ncbi:MAG: site-2 protease family protein, partial [Acidimicrobiia bacterium]|nr:site-2 protease family protein [Acidimicrobiia bacterium]